MVLISKISTNSVKRFFLAPIQLYSNRAYSLAVSIIRSTTTLSRILLRVFSRAIGRQLPRSKQSALPSLRRINVIIALLSLRQQPIIKYTLAISASQGTISSPQVFRALFRILSSPSAILFKRWLIVLAISLVIISLSTLKRVAGISPVISLRSTGAGQGKNLSIRIFTFSLLLLIASSSPILYIGGRYGSSTRRPAFFFTYFAII